MNFKDFSVILSKLLCVYMIWLPHSTPAEINFKVSEVKARNNIINNYAFFANHTLILVIHITILLTNLKFITYSCKLLICMGFSVLCMMACSVTN